MVKSRPYGKVSVGVLEVVRHAVGVRGCVVFEPLGSQVGGVLDERYRHAFRCQVGDPALIGIDVRITETVQENGQWQMGDG